MSLSLAAGAVRGPGFVGGAESAGGAGGAGGGSVDAAENDGLRAVEETVRTLLSVQVEAPSNRSGTRCGCRRP